MYILAADGRDGSSYFGLSGREGVSPADPAPKSPIRRAASLPGGNPMVCVGAPSFAWFCDRYLELEKTPIDQILHQSTSFDEGTRHTVPF